MKRSTSNISESQTSVGRTVDDEVWLALHSLRASHRDPGCQRAECAIASLSDQDLQEILSAIRETVLDDACTERDAAAAEIATMRPARSFEGTGGGVRDLVSPVQMTVVGTCESSPAGVISESEEEEPRFEVGSRVVYDPEAEVNLELEGDYASLGVCTVTELDVAAHGQLLSFVDERGDIHDGWWADRFKVAPTEATAEGGEDDVTYFVAFRSAAGYGYRVLDPRPRIVAAADVVALTDSLAADVGGDVVPLNWIELPLPLPMTTQARQVAVNHRGSSTEIQSTVAPIRIDPGHDRRVLNGSIPPTGRTLQTDPVQAAAPGERPARTYLPRRAM